MVKRGTKRKIDIEKITNRNSRATSFTKRSHGLYSKAAQLCLLADAQIAVLATPSSSNSNVSFFSFGHSSVEAIVSAYLSGEKLAPVSTMDSKEMREDLGVCFESSGLGLGHWWEDEERFKNPQDIMEGIKSMKTLLSLAQRLRTKDAMNVIDQTLTIDIDDDDDFVPAKRLRTKEAVNVIDQTLIIDVDDLVPVSSSNDETAEREQIMSVSDTFCNNYNNDDLSAHVAGNLDEWSDIDLAQLIDFDDENHTSEEEAHHQISENLCSNNNNALLLENQTQEEEDDHQIVAVSETSCSNNNGLGNMVDEQKLLDLDFKTIFEGPIDQDHAEWTDMELDQLLNDLDDENQTEEDKEDHQISENICNNNHNGLLPEHQTQEEEDHHQIVDVSENFCNNNNALLPAGNMDDEFLDPEIDLDFETIFKGMTDKELDEFGATFFMS